jgi:AraC-like DNA-binding protein
VKSSSFEYVTPSAAVAGLVAFHYVFCAGDAPFSDMLCALLGQVQLAQLGSAQYQLAGTSTPCPPLAVIGPTDKAVRMTAMANFVGVGAALTPLGWSRLIGPRDLANQVVAADTVFGSHAARLTSRLAESSDPAAALVALDAFLVERLVHAPPPDPRIALIDACIVDESPRSVEDIAEALGLSRRSLERLTRRTHGATPKRLTAKYRALKAAARMAVGLASDWRQASTPGEFSDQPHFIREFRRYVGVSPGMFMADPQLFARRLIEGQWKPGKALGVAIWM